MDMERWNGGHGGNEPLGSETQKNERERGEGGRSMCQPNSLTLAIHSLNCIHFVPKRASRKKPSFSLLLDTSLALHLLLLSSTTLLILSPSLHRHFIQLNSTQLNLSLSLATCHHQHNHEFSQQPQKRTQESTQFTDFTSRLAFTVTALEPPPFPLDYSSRTDSV
ncbi:MAG: hypothetical protein JOS17DRAFT_88401 [Linnemannia elongata]|nr:MAG: hypothetical protein JOS17DRAFT_88401 [Linnemannia elongata]